MGISGNVDQEIAWPSEYQNPEDAQTFAQSPFVRLRFLDARARIDRQAADAPRPRADPLVVAEI
jgi:hypothetical protein